MIRKREREKEKNGKKIKEEKKKLVGILYICGLQFLCKENENLCLLPY
jgi:hypothetical protein